MKQINQTSFTSWIFLLSLATIWGVNFLFIKLAVEEIGPITNVFLRLLMASIILYVVMKLQNQKLVLKPKLILFYFILGAFGLAIPFSLISSAEIHINAGLAGVLMSPMPLLTLALSAIILKNEIINFVSKGLRDFSISRVNLKWGINVPGNKDHTFYVWFDALLGYVSGSLNDQGTPELTEKSLSNWPASMHVIGKDILRFHAVYWPAMLLSAGLKTPRSVFGHGFLTREGQKMGKSLGNVLDPIELLEYGGIDAMRWYLLRDIEFGEDGDFQMRRFVDIVNSDLSFIFIRSVPVFLYPY